MADPANTEKSGIDELKAQLATAIEKLGKLETNMSSGLNGLRSMYDRRVGELQQKIAKIEGTDRPYDAPYNSGTAAPAPNTRSDEDFVAEETDRFERERDRFERRHNDYVADSALRTKVDALLADQSRRAEILSHDARGRVDYAKTYRTAYLEAKNQIADEARAAGDKLRAQADEERKNAKTDAALSGDSIEELPEGLTLDSLDAMSPEDMVKKGLVPGIKSHRPIVGV